MLNLYPRGSLLPEPQKGALGPGSHTPKVERPYRTSTNLQRFYPPLKKNATLAVPNNRKPQAVRLRSGSPVGESGLWCVGLKVSSVRVSVLDVEGQGGVEIHRSRVEALITRLVE